MYPRLPIDRWWIPSEAECLGLEQRKTVKVVSFNESGQRRLGGFEGIRMLQRTVTELYPDIFGVQEHGKYTHTDIDSLLHHVTWENGVSANDIYMNPVGRNHYRFELVSTETKWLSDTPDVRSKGWEGEERAYTLVVLKDLLNEGREFVHLNTHLDNKSDSARVRATERILEVLARPTYAKLPAIVTGDFNCSPVPAPEGEELPYTTKPYELFLKSDFEHAWRTAHPDEDYPATYHNRLGLRYRGDRYRTWHVDWIMVRDFEVERCDLGYIAEPYQYPSDHWAVVAELRHK